MPKLGETETMLLWRLGHSSNRSIDIDPVALPRTKEKDGLNKEESRKLQVLKNTIFKFVPVTNQNRRFLDFEWSKNIFKNTNIN